MASEEKQLTGLIIAAGKGERMSPVCPVKPLLQVGGQALIDWTAKALLKAGLRDLVVVVGYEAEKIKEHLLKQPYLQDVNLEFVLNEEWDKENGLSVYKARELVGERFFLVMSDHIFDPEILRELQKQPLEDDELILAVDFRTENHPFVDLEDVTRVLVNEGHIMGIGKGIANYNAFDTGIFYCSQALFPALEESQRLSKNFTLSGGIRIMALKGKARVMDIDSRFWADVDEEKMWKKVEEYLAGEGKHLKS
jgi:choline kinase